jgi:hypothetical protein
LLSATVACQPKQPPHDRLPCPWLFNQCIAVSRQYPCIFSVYVTLPRQQQVPCCLPTVPSHTRSKVVSLQPPCAALRGSLIQAECPCSRKC